MIESVRNFISRNTIDISFALFVFVAIAVIIWLLSLSTTESELANFTAKYNYCIA